MNALMDLKNQGNKSIMRNLSTVLGYIGGVKSESRTCSLILNVSSHKIPLIPPHSHSLVHTCGPLRAREVHQGQLGAELLHAVVVSGRTPYVNLQHL